METAADRPSTTDAALRWILVVLVAFTLIAALASCQTYTVVVEAPEEFWLTAENLILAVFADIWWVIEHVF